jgi:mRNA-degrading endonuclease RelE of RelBE toxin-antitoxin system
MRERDSADKKERCMAEYAIEMTEEAKSDLDFYDVTARRTIVSAIRQQLMHEPLTQTRNRKPLRDHPLATWELRVERYRVFYEVDQPAQAVIVTSIGHKERNVLLVRGSRVPL